jgi:hypothetical protein
LKSPQIWCTQASQRSQATQPSSSSALFLRFSISTLRTENESSGTASPGDWVKHEWHHWPWSSVCAGGE